MGDILEVQFGALQQASANIETALRTIESQLSDVEAAAEPLVGSWTGDAKAAYEQRQIAWRSAANELSTILRDIKVAVDDSAADYMSTEKRNTGLFQ
jgi:6 kDa early secretory antigenic target